MRITKTYIVIALIAAITINAVGCASVKPVGKAYAADLMDGVSPNRIIGRMADAAFVGSMADFSVELFKKSLKDGENSLISPLSVMLALAMTTNGANGETLMQMETLLGGDIPIETLNEYLYSYVNNLPNKDKSKLNIANSIWFRDDGDVLHVEADFLQSNADYYDASAYRAPFDASTVSDINNWVKVKTNGMIDTIIEGEIDELAMLFLINAVMFDAEWQNVYYKTDVREGEFTDITGNKRLVDFMHSGESLYLDDGMATGFIKPYANGGYSFAALLPNEGISIDEYIESLTGGKLLGTLNNAERAVVIASMPKFEYDYDLQMNDVLIALGIPTAFDMDNADFHKMATVTVGNKNLYISKVVHKTYISVDELGTKAGAVTKVEIAAGGSSGPTDIKVVNLDRPFVYALIDNATNLPVFIGTLVTVGK